MYVNFSRKLFEQYLANITGIVIPKALCFIFDNMFQGIIQIDRLGHLMTQSTQLVGHNRHHSEKYILLRLIITSR